VATLDLADFLRTPDAEGDFAEDFFGREALLTISASDLQSEHERYRFPLSLRVFGCLPVTGATECTEAGVRKAWKEETAAGVCASAAVGLWEFSARV
jgi:hypothetical protein